MQKFEFLRQPLLGELVMSRKKEERRENNAIYSGHLRLCQQPRAAHALRSDQFVTGRVNRASVLDFGPGEGRKSSITKYKSFLYFNYILSLVTQVVISVNP